MIPGAESHVDAHARALRRFFRRQGDELIPAAAQGLAMIAQQFASPRWDDELQEVVLASALRTVRAFAGEIADRFGRTFEVDDELLAELTGYAGHKASSVNITTRDELVRRVDELEPGDDSPEARRSIAGELLAGMATTRALLLAGSAVTTEANHGRAAAAADAGVARKRWVVTSSNPRGTHAAINGQRVPFGSRFTNGARWPGDPILPVAERAQCRCIVEFEEALA